MTHILYFLFSFLTSTFRSRLSLQLEIAALRHQLSSYLDYYHPWRTHRSLDQDAPDGRPLQLAKPNQIAEFLVVQELHHYYLPKAA